MRRGKTRPGYDHVNVHMILEINMEWKFTRKAILVNESHTTSPSSYITNSSAVSREIVRIVFSCSIGNEYLNVKRRGNFGKKRAQSLGLKR